uniref:Ribonuclease P protein subunit p29 n=1 Tax=Daphnia similis TaxID=35528 RepID=A0A4Y7LT35_9CRUS|nr:EOG090X0GV5 [Daphnia similis]SVE71394.1 EOG090X0GV5 [Daphnia similis]SVE72027.1 EOG090X0GV5 [Daphnia similis]SVE72654.1 EOG090X0GV5 [Daphnia similis]
MEKDENNKESEMMIYKPLPVEIRVTLEQQSLLSHPTQSSIKKSEEGFLMSYIQPRTPVIPEDLTTQFKKNFPLKIGRPAKENKKTRTRKKALTSIEKRRLGLHKLPKTGIKYKACAPLHQLWVEYMENFLELENSANAANKDLLYQRIAKADYHGCLLMVTRSKCPSYIGAKGIIVLETKNTFQIICEDDQLRIIPKRDSVFTFNVSKWTFTLFGNHMNIRPSERAARKFKSKPTIDL